MKALIGMIDNGNGIVAIEVDDLVLQPPYCNPIDVLSPWAATGAQLLGLLQGGRLREMHPDTLVFPDDAGSRFGGPRMLHDQTQFIAACAAAGASIAALHDGSDDLTQQAWRLWWPWNGSGSDAAQEASEMLARVLVEMRCAQEIFDAGRDLKGRHGRAMRSDARNLAEAAGTMCAANYGSTLMDALTAIGLRDGHLRIRDQLLDNMRRASEGSHHVDVTEQALSDALYLAGAISETLQNRIAQGVLATLDAPGWVPGRSSSADSREPVSHAATQQ